MLLDALGIIIGFVAIVLLLSILVTAIVQTLSNLTRLRNHALSHGVTESGLAKTVEDIATPSAQASTSTASQLIQFALRKAQQPLSDKRATWLENEEIIEPLRDAGVGAQELALAQHKLNETRRVTDTKYLQWARVITFFTAVVVAIVFQVSAPHLLQRLHQDADFRARAEALGERLAKEPEPKGDIRGTTSQLAGFDIRPWADPKFYGQLDPLRIEFGRIVGVLFMAVLLSFGAPFWYKALKELIGLKDALRKKADQAASS
jgi:hypothetical protein